MKIIYNLKSILILIFLINFSSFGYAVDIPTVDDLNKQVPQLPGKKEPNASEKLNELDKEVLPNNEEKILKVLVKNFILEGNKRYNDETLKNLIKENINKELDYDALLNVTTLISNYYRSKGFLATSYLPPQDIKNGIVQIKITEAELGKITFNVEKSQKLNLSKERIRKKILYKVKDDGGLNIAQLDKNIRNPLILICILYTLYLVLNKVNQIENQKLGYNSFFLSNEDKSIYLNFIDKFIVVLLKISLILF